MYNHSQKPLEEFPAHNYQNLLNQNSYTISQTSQQPQIHSQSYQQYSNNNNNISNTNNGTNINLFSQNNLQSNTNNQKLVVGENYDHQISDSMEVKELKNRMKIIMNKLNNTKREKETIQKENKCLQEEVMALQSNLRNMISGFSNTSSAFPMLNELIDQTQEFYKYDCLDMFFDILCPELNMKGILFFFHTSFSKLQEVVINYFNPANNIIKKLGCFDTIDGPIMNVLRKSYQQNYKEILSRCLNKEVIDSVCKQIQNNLKLGGNSEEMNQNIKEFLIKLGEIFFYYYISDPPLNLEYKQIGTKIQFNPLKHDPFDGFIKNKQECVIVLPSIFKNSDKEELVKALVLEVDYEIPN